MPTGTVRLTNAVFYARHGVSKAEQEVGGRYEVDIALELDVESAAETDSLDETVDYARVYSTIREIITEGRFSLIERGAALIAREVTAVYPQVGAVEVTLRKVNPPVGGPCEAAEVVYRSENAG